MAGIDEKAVRILDANRNRISEAFRTIEDILRFYCENRELSYEIKNLRHNAHKIFEDMEKKYGIRLIEYRDSLNDVGRDDDYDRFGEVMGYKKIAERNFKRIAESLRVCEEICKLFDNGYFAPQFKRIRFTLYDVEKKSYIALR